MLIKKTDDANTDFYDDSGVNTIENKDVLQPIKYSNTEYEDTKEI